MNRPARLLCLSALALAVAWPRTGHADLSKSRWQAPERPPGWPTLSLATSVAASAGAGARYVLKPARHLRWGGGVWLDVRLRSLSAGSEASAWGQVPLYYTTPLLPRPQPVIGSWSERGSYQAPRLELVSWEALRDAAPLSGMGAPLPPPSADVLHHVVTTAATGGSAHSLALTNASGVEPRASREGSDQRSATGATTVPGSPLGSYTMPALLRYSDEETNVLVTIQPGGPCTGACLRVAGSF